MDARHLERLLDGERRQDGGDAPREHRLAGAGGTDHEQVVPAGHGHLDGALGEILALDVRKVVAAVAAGRHEQAQVFLHGFERELAGEEVRRLAQGMDGIDVDAVDDRGLGGVVHRHQNAFFPNSPHFEDDRKDALRAADLARKSEFADERVVR